MALRYCVPHYKEIIEIHYKGGPFVNCHLLPRLHQKGRAVGQHDQEHR